MTLSQITKKIPRQNREQKMKRMLLGIALSASLGLMGILKAETKDTSTNTTNAESNGFFAGLDLGWLWKYANVKSCHNNFCQEQEGSAKGGGITYGALFGYKHFFDEKLGFRTYITLSGEGRGRAVGPHSSSPNFLGLINGDLLYNFRSKKLDSGEYLNLGIFAGLGLGYRHDGVSAAYREFLGYSAMKPHRFELRVNLGVRGVIAKYHSFEVYGAIGTIPYIEKQNINNNNDTTLTFKTWYPFNFGVRYIYNFSTNLDHIFKKKS